MTQPLSPTELAALRAEHGQLCDCADWLKGQARRELKAADSAASKAGTDARRREHSHRDRFKAYGWAAGELARRNRFTP